MMGGSAAHEFMVLTPAGEDTIVICDGCGYTANRQVATFARPTPDSEARPVTKVATPDASTIAAVAACLGVDESETAKAYFATARVHIDSGESEILVLAIVRGDMEVNETKLANAVRAIDMRPALDDEIRAVGAVPGYASPVGLQRGESTIVVVDPTAAATKSLVGGANEEGYHLVGTCCGRDYEPDIVADIASARDGYPCPECGEPLHTKRGVEVGNIFKLGTRYSDALGCTYQDEEGKSRPVVMGSYGIGVGRALACIAEVHNDDRGLVWPISVSPFDVHLVALKGAELQADRAYGALQEAGLEVLYDDRAERPGVKFNDADLIGIPIRLTAGERSLQQGGLELKLRRDDHSRIVSSSDLISEVLAVAEQLRSELDEV
jgi:prolyl-tRNA synthetase